ncbi:hypothetical protein [Taibaiella koreensis]|uniref:hypothetical protein n=1 Tax=Taibaiella koreensis TaxID=1268548 RepID=UPI000E59CB10|nr:hypothetical protein [Taibaiella koreensis]
MQLKRLRHWLFPLAILLLVIAISTSCRKEKFLTSGGEIAFSLDTLTFDTVFTQQGSATRSIRIFNKQKDKIMLSSIRLRKGEKSPYRLNVNGQPGKEIRDVEVAGNDSVWVFAAITIDPTNENDPFVVDDDLVVTLNGKDFSLPLMAYGQNAYYIRDSVLQTQTWRTDKPYVIVHNAVVDEGQTLTIPAGARVYVHRDSRLYVLGTLKINGTAADSVIFQGDRLDPLVWIGDYIDIPGQWGGLYFFKQSYGNVINHAVFKNGGAITTLNGQAAQGATIQIDADTVKNGTPKLTINNSVIYSSQGYGILAFNSSLQADNCRITECGGENVMFFDGGNYKMRFCTIGTYGSSYLSHTENLSMAVLNYIPTGQTTYDSHPLTADIRNCIVYGSLTDEIFIDAKPESPAAVTLGNCLLKSTEPIPGFVAVSNNKLNQDPLFVDYSKANYHLQEGSPAKGAGQVIPGLTVDFDGKPRGNPPSAGCYE